MSTIIKPELSEKNQYYIPKYRFLELRNYCLQYPEWKKELRNRDGYKTDLNFSVRETINNSSVENAVIKRDKAYDKVMCVVEAARLTDEELVDYIIKGVTLGVSYDYLKLRCGIPCSRDTYYRRYRKFFFILDKIRG